MAARTVKVTNVSLSATVQDVKEFFSFSGDVEYIEMQSADEWSQISYVTFRDSQGAETALLLSGATVVDHSVIIVPAPEYRMLVIASAPPVTKDDNATGDAGSAIHKAEDVVSSKLSKVFTLGKDALKKAKDFDEKHQLTSTASAKVASFDKKIGLSEKISTGTAAVSEKFKEVDLKFQVSGRTKSALATTEQKVSIAGSAIMKNRYVLTGASWVTGAFNKVAKAASEVGSKTKEKVVTEQEHKKGFEEDFDEIYLSDQTPKAALSKHSSKPPPA